MAGAKGNRMATKARITSEEFWRMPSSDMRQELVSGEVVEMMPPAPLHGYIVTKIARRLDEHVEKHGLGWVMAGDPGFVLRLPWDDDRVRAPDVAFLSRARVPEGKLPKKFFHGAPDLAVEVLSPSESPVDVQQKVRDWLEGGARLVWTVAPEAASATVYRPDGSARLVRDREPLEGEDVLPGFTVPLAEVLE